VTNNKIEGMGLMDFFRIGKSKEVINEMLERGAIIVDVRTPGEFNTGNVEKSINIPLDMIESSINRIKKMNAPIVLCCATGMRSGSASNILKQHDIECCNGGSWSSLR